MADLLGIHSGWTQPTRQHIPKIAEMLQFEAVTMALSCLWWRQLHGPIKLYCDQPFLQKIQAAGLSELWTEIDVAVLESSPTLTISPDHFWAWAKMYINSLQTEPFVSLDLDLFINKPYDFKSHDLIFSHLEKTDKTGSKIKFYPNYQDWPEIKPIFADWPWLKFTKQSINVSILAVNDLDFYQEFFKIAAHFVLQVDSNQLVKDNIHAAAPMTFIEQRLLAAVSRAKNISIKPILNLEFQPGSSWLGEDSDLVNPGITHLWGLKDLCRRPGREIDRLQLSQNLENHFAANFPIEYKRLMPKIKEYYAQ